MVREVGGKNNSAQMNGLRGVLWFDKIVSRLTHSQYRAARLTHYPLSHGAHAQPVKSATAMRSHHDQVRRAFGGETQNGFPGEPLAYETLRLQSISCMATYQPLHALFSFACQLDPRILQHHFRKGVVGIGSLQRLYDVLYQQLCVVMFCQGIRIIISLDRKL